MAAKDTLMMHGSNLVQVGGMLVLGPCKNPSQSEQAYLMVGGVAADEYVDRFYELAKGKIRLDYGYKTEEFVNDASFTFNDFPEYVDPFGRRMPWGAKFGFTSYGQDSYSPIHFWLVDRDDSDSDLSARNFRSLCPADGDMDKFVRFRLLQALENGYGNVSSTVRVDVQRRVKVMKAPDSIPRDQYPQNDDLHFYGDDIWVEVGEDWTPVPPDAVWMAGEWYRGKIPGWNPGVSGDAPSIAVFRVDEDGVRKEILWQSR